MPSDGFMIIDRRSLFLGLAAAATASELQAQGSGPTVVAVVGWRGSTVQLFFSDRTYGRVDLATGTREAGYPKPVNDGTWPGLGDYAGDIVAACNWPGGKLQFFLKGGRTIRYDVAADRADPDYPRPITAESWPGLAADAKQIAATLNWPGDKLQVFLREGRYIRYDGARDRADPGYPQPVDEASWPGVAAYKGLFGGMLNIDNAKALIFLTDGRFVSYDIAADRIDAGFPKLL